MRAGAPESAASFDLALPPDRHLSEAGVAQVFAGDWASDWAQAQQPAWS